MEKTNDNERGSCLEDRISGLPDALLISILSLLTMKEAGRTSLLSKRWRYMWTYITALNFDALHIIYGLKLGDKRLDVERPLYLSWVNQVLKSYNGPSLDEFRVQFDLDETCRFDINNWVNFAMEKRVKRLDLDVSNIEHRTRKEEDYIYHITNHPRGFTSYNSLTNLQLKYVNVTGQVLEYFLTNCPFLEQLTVHKSDGLVNLKVSELSLKLTRLAITDCYNVESIEISAMNLVSFKYYGPKISLPFKNVPPPVEMFIGGEYCDNLICNFLEFSSYLSLESLTLHLAYYDENSIEDVKFPVFNKLKQLELIISAGDNESLTVLVPLIELQWFKTAVRRKLESVEICPLQYLKVVEFVGWVGRPIDTELATYLIKSAVMLEKITFDPRKPYLIGTPWEFMETKGKRAARKRAEKLRKKLPPGAAFVIL
ncbi:FBD-associated F-box protein At4g10400-like [Cornus florida]|uniref:FBD-associated F-box protein At4g10400-like n=1 Tax=Cornus florida TaxID=4283 RepID=UPI00289CDF20|nr:FBD-associated F-box protein At4g10400-like [Cornus florida]